MHMWQMAELKNIKKKKNSSALRKKLNCITQMEEAIAQGKPINKEQEEVCSKPAVLSLIDELDKLCQPLAQVVAEELSLLTYDYVTDDATDLLNERDLIRFRCSAAC